MPSPSTMSLLWEDDALGSTEQVRNNIMLAGLQQSRWVFCDCFSMENEKEFLRRRRGSIIFVRACVLDPRLVFVERRQRFKLTRHGRETGTSRPFRLRPKLSGFPNPRAGFPFAPATQTFALQLLHIQTRPKPVRFHGSAP